MMAVAYFGWRRVLLTIIAILASIAPVFSIRYKHEKAANIMKVMFAASISPSSIATNIAKGPTGVLGIYLKLEGSMTVLPIVSSRTRAYCPAGMIYVAIVAATMTKNKITKICGISLAIFFSGFMVILLSNHKKPFLRLSCRSV